MDILWLRPDKPDDISVGRHRIANELEKRGHEIEIWNASFGDFAGILRRSPDVVVGTTRLGAFICTWKRMANRTPLVVDHIDPIDQLRRTRGPIMTYIINHLEQLSFRMADQVLVTYKEEYERVERYAASATRTSLGVDYERFANPPEKIVDDAIEVLNQHVSPDSAVLIYVGGLEPAYHIRELIKTLDHLDGWELVILGDGTERSIVEAASRERETVHYLGTVPYESVPGYLHRADVGISLIDDPNTLKILEYGAAGLPVVHVQGTAEERLGDEVAFCTTEPVDIAAAVLTAASSENRGLRELASQHRWETIADTYEMAIQRAVSKTECEN